MNDEIKEILAYFEEYVKITDMHDSEPMLNWKDLKIVLDYITNLQQELEKRNAYIKYLEEYNPKYYKGEKFYGDGREDYKSRIEKAEKYINYYGTTPEENDDTTCRHILKSLLNILNGKE